MYLYVSPVRRLNQRGHVLVRVPMRHVNGDTYKDMSPCGERRKPGGTRRRGEGRRGAEICRRRRRAEDDEVVAHERRRLHSRRSRVADTCDCKPLRGETRTPPRLFRGQARTPPRLFMAVEEREESLLAFPLHSPSAPPREPNQRRSSPGDAETRRTCMAPLSGSSRSGLSGRVAPSASPGPSHRPRVSASPRLRAKQSTRHGRARRRMQWHGLALAAIGGKGDTYEYMSPTSRPGSRGDAEDVHGTSFRVFAKRPVRARRR